VFLQKPHYLHAPSAFVGSSAHSVCKVQLPVISPPAVATVKSFGSPFPGFAKDKKISHEELIRAIRFTIAAECEATEQYMKLAESTDHTLTIQVLTEIANEERVHAGELLRLLYALSPDEAKFYAKGAIEVEGKIEE
jgi:hypothetical protein